MIPIQPPIKTGQKGAEVANLQEGMIFILDKRVLDIEPGFAEDLRNKISDESHDQYYGEATAKMVRIFQELRQLNVTGEINEETAAALNQLLRELDAFSDTGWADVLRALQAQGETLRTINEDTNYLSMIDATVRGLGARTRMVSGHVRDIDKQPVRGGTVYAFHETDQAAVRLGEGATDGEGGYTIRYDLLPGLQAINLRVALISNDGRSLTASNVIQNARPVEAIDLVAPITGSGVSKRSIVGRVTLADGRPAEGITLRLIRRAFGGAATTLDQTTTQVGGRYALSFTLDPAAASLQIHAVRASGEIVPLEAQLNYLGREARITRNLVAPSDLIARPVEFRRMVADLQPHIGDIATLAEAKETTERPDLTTLNRATRWDARLLAQGALAARLSADEQTPTSVEAFYGLLRAGMPSDKTLMAQVDADVAAAALTAVRDAGIIGLDNDQIEAFKKDFQSFSTNVRLSMPVPGGNTSYSQMLGASGLEENVRNSFANVYAKHGANAEKLWTEALAAGLTEQNVSQLQLQGKLAFLTSGSQEMTAHLIQKQIGDAPVDAGGVDRARDVGMALNDPAQLADLGLYTETAWGAMLDEAATATGKGVESIIPSAYIGAPEQRRKEFSADMAHKVQISYPMQVLAHELRNDAEDAFKLGTARASVAQVLRVAAGQGYRMGVTSVDDFVETHPGVTSGLNADEINIVKAGLKDLQRTQQICPDNATTKALRSAGIFSAYDVIAMSKETFINHLGPVVSSPKVPEMIYRKAEQVSSVVYNLFAIANQIESQVVLYGASPPADVRQNVKNELIKHYPTLETLFGSMDFCECEHCRSVLSPAAYLVDLLQYVEGEDAARAGFETRWKAQHADQSYTSRYALPYDALIKRRPDLPHIPLTCENTNTALPYIDIVNEILEYYVAQGALAPAAAQDTGEATTAELLAEPQHVIREAYEAVRSARYPLTLPIDLWLETVRQFCNFAETPLADLLETFRPGDALFAPTQLYDRADIFIESLGLSPVEAALFTDPNPLAGGKWFELFGYTTRGTVIGNPNNGAADATLTLPNKPPFAVNDRVTYYDVSAGGVHSETMSIKAIGADDSGGAGRTLVTLQDVWVNPPVAGDELIAAAPALLASAKTLSRRLGITYKEIIEIIKTSFVNPRLVELTLLYKLGATVQDVLFYRDQQAFYKANKGLLGKERKDLTPADQARYDNLTQPDTVIGLTGWERIKRVQALLNRLAAASVEFAPFDALDWVNTALATNAFNDVLVLADPNAGCDFDATTLRYADGRSTADIDFLRINLFVRLWRKLGWTIEETDRALTTFTQNLPFIVTNLSQQPLRAALIYLSHLKRLDEKVRVGAGSRLKLLALWSDLATTGRKPLYAQLFLTRSARKSGEVEIVPDLAKKDETLLISIFDSRLGRFLHPADLKGIAELVRYRVSVSGVKAADQLRPQDFAGEPKVGIEYDALGEVQTLTYRGILTNAAKAQLALLSNSPVLPKLLDAVQIKANEFTLIKGHLPALQGALGLAADEIDRILKDANLDTDTAALTLQNVSLLYRYGLLAKALKLSVGELISLKALSGINPFRTLHAAPLQTLAEDYPFSQTLRFVEVVEAIKESGLTIEDLDYLLRHQLDSQGKYRAKTEENLLLLKTLAEGIRAIRAEHALPTNPESLTDEILQQKLSLMLPTDVVQRLLAMMNGAAEFTATQTGVNAIGALAADAFAAVPAIVAVSPLNAARGEQKLTYRGVLFKPTQTALEAQFNALPAEKKATLNALLTSVRQQARDFFDNQLKKQPLRQADEAGYLEESDFVLLFTPLPMPENEAIAEKNRNELEKRRARIAAAFLPVLQARLIRQLVVQTVTAQMGTDPVLVESLLTDERLLGLPAGAASRQLIDVLIAPAERGIDAAFFNSSDLNGAQQASKPIVASADTTLKDKKDKDGNPLSPAGSARFAGYLEVPSVGAYRFYVVLDKKDAAFKLHFHHLPNPIFLEGTAGNDGAVFGTDANQFLELKPGLLYRFELEVKKLNSGQVRLLVQGEAMPKGALGQLTLYSASALQSGEQALLLLSKVLQLVQTLGLSEREVRYVLTHAADFANVSLSELPAAEIDESDPAKSAAVIRHFDAFLRLADYARLKHDLAGGTDDLITLFETNATTGSDRLDALVYPHIAKLTRRDVSVVKTVANALFAAPTFANEEPLLRLWAALQVVGRFGISVASLRSWTGIVDPNATPEMRFAIARDVRETIKARLEPEAWQAVARPIFDRLRQRQRDALVAHVMHTRGFERLEQLYEYFLIDPGMEPVVQTSRIRLAISSVQLFIQRCLLNLEAEVHPTAILNPEHWEWMKRYRVWEANRKIFLFPENWLEPEFRDDKSHLYTELEGTLLQGDVSRDLVEDAFLNYLRKLDELARLDIVAMHLDQRDDPGQNVLHVIGRTYAEPHKYFYRRFAAGMWTPWEPVTTEITGDHLAPVIWRDRLYLFWITFMEKAEPTTEKIVIDYKTSQTISPAPVTYLEAQLHWSEYLNGEWSTHESGSMDESSVIKLSGMTLSETQGILIHVSKKYVDGEERGVYVNLDHNSSKKAFYLAGRNSNPVEPDANTTLATLPANLYSNVNERRANRYAGKKENKSLNVTFTQRITTEPGKPAIKNPKDILASVNGHHTLLPLNHPMRVSVPKEAYEDADKPEEVKKALENSKAEIESLIKPVFFQDDLHTFFIQPDVVERTIEEWQTWIEPVQEHEPYPVWPPPWLKNYIDVYVPPQIPEIWPPLEELHPLPWDPGDPVPDYRDWIVNPATVLLFDEQTIGPHGMVPLTYEQGIPATAQTSALVYVNASGAVNTGAVAMLKDRVSLSDVGLKQAPGGLNVIGMAGINAGIMQNVKLFGAGIPGGVPGK